MKDKIIDLFQQAMNITPEILSVTKLGGLTNVNYQVETSEGDFVVRYPGIGTEHLISRRDEFEFTKLSNDLGIDAHNYYFDPDTGIKISQYVPYAVTFTPELIREEENFTKVASLFRELHHANRTVDAVFNVFEKITEYENLIKATQRNTFWEDYEEVRGKIYGLKKEYDNFNVPLAFCHNDPLCENFVLGEERLFLVDWEYGGMNDPLWDLADVMIEGEMDNLQEEAFKKAYFQREPTVEEERRIMMNKVFLDFLWSLWGKQRFSVGEDDMQSYADQRYVRMKENLRGLMSTSSLGEK